ncbi:MAG: hypothetical protein MRECE_33c025 [Mycoplasmataceae bacterium CE_OT135]|nr:MAG: hypothetical protein MRECE_33c025 [Mycoplasmataceae bacterium CE_OT135]
MKNKLCQTNYPNCQKTAQFQHTLKLGSLKIAKQWVCGHCKQHLETEAKK